MRTGIGQFIGSEARADTLECVDKNLARVGVFDLVIFQFEWRNAAADADFEPAVTQVVEHADFVDHAQRRDERQQIHQRPEAHATGRARDRAKKHTGHRHHVERSLVVLSKMQAIKTGFVARCKKV